MPQPSPLLQTKNLSRVYPGAQPVVAVGNVNLIIQQGEFLSIVGPSGSGKSTLMNLLGLLDVPTDGEIWYQGQSVAGWGESQKALFRNQSMGFIFQAHLLMPEFTALENVLMPCLIRQSATPEKRQTAQSLLERIGLGDRLHHRPSELSGGQNQRVAIARALVNRPAIVFADEPTGALDSKTSLAVYELMREINREDRVSFVIVTHERDLAARTDRVISMRDGLLASDDLQEASLT